MQGVSLAGNLALSLRAALSIIITYTVESLNKIRLCFFVKKKKKKSQPSISKVNEKKMKS